MLYFTAENSQLSDMRQQKKDYLHEWKEKSEKHVKFYIYLNEDSLSNHLM